MSVCVFASFHCLLPLEQINLICQFEWLVNKYSNFEQESRDYLWPICAKDETRFINFSLLKIHQFCMAFLLLPRVWIHNINPRQQKSPIDQSNMRERTIFPILSATKIGSGHVSLPIKWTAKIILSYWKFNSIFFALRCFQSSIDEAKNKTAHTFFYVSAIDLWNIKF